MVSVKIQGGLGNQLFQYAAAYSLARRVETDVCVEASFFKDQTPRLDFTPREFLLELLGIRARKLTARQTERIASAPKAGIKESLSALLWRKIRRIPVKYVEDEPTFNPELFQVRGHLHLDGYFQDYRYAEPARDHIKTRVMKSKNQAGSARKHIPTGSICLHIRRGDYAARKDVAELLGVCSDDYYKRALQFLRAQGVKSPVYVFSDDVEHAHLLFNNLHNVQVWKSSKRGDTTVEDFLAMMSCKHFIISNSSYSFWAAWLAAENDSVVCCPSPWYNRVDWHTYSPVPPQWINLARA